MKCGATPEPQTQAKGLFWTANHAKLLLVEPKNNSVNIHSLTKYHNFCYRVCYRICLYRVSGCVRVFWADSFFLFCLQLLFLTHTLTWNSPSSSMFCVFRSWCTRGGFMLWRKLTPRAISYRILRRKGQARTGYVSFCTAETTNES